MFPGKRFKLVEIPILTGAQNEELKFPTDLSELKEKKVICIQPFISTELAIAASGKTVVNSTDGSKWALRVAQLDGSKSRLELIPYNSLNKVLNYGILQTFEPFFMNAENSRLLATASGSTIGQALLVGIWFED